VSAFEAINVRPQFLAMFDAIAQRCKTPITRLAKLNRSEMTTTT
jgi:hypothetical protein